MTEYIIRPPERVDSSLDLQPIIVGEIVRCRDCRHYEKLSDDKGVCHPLGIVFADMDDGFCAWAVKRTEAENG